MKNIKNIFIKFYIINIRIDSLYKSVIFSQLTSKGITNSLCEN